MERVGQFKDKLRASNSDNGIPNIEHSIGQQIKDAYQTEHDQRDNGSQGKTQSLATIAMNQSHDHTMPFKLGDS